jgi:hypothetical protein
LILGSYRTGDANDPDTYVRVIAAVLTCYPVEIMKEVSDPRWGIATKIKWLPTLYDVKDACEAAMQPVYRREREAAHAAERRQRLSAPNVPRPTLAELQAKYGENWGLHSEGLGKTKWQPRPLAELLKESGVSPEAFEEVNTQAEKSLRDTARWK